MSGSYGLDDQQLAGLEAVLFLADEPVEPVALAELLDTGVDEVEAACEGLARDHEAAGRGVAVRRAAAGWRMYTAPLARPIVERWALSGRSGRLTQASLETLAVIAYKQPISRHDVGEIRGVNPDGAVRSLVARGLVAEVARDPGPGQAVLYGTTRTFLERLGLQSLDELPPLTDFLPESPAPDEPELGALHEVRRRLAAGGDLPSRGLGGRSDADTNTGVADTGESDEDADLLPPPSGIHHDRDDEMDELADRLDDAARNAVGRLRAVMSAQEAAEPADDPAEPADDPAEPADEPDESDAADHDTSRGSDG